MAIITVTTPFNIDLEFKVASFGKRVTAWGVDFVVICVYYYIMLAMVYPLVRVNSGLGTAASYLTLIIPVVVYQLAFEIMMNGQTPGKKLMRIKIIDVAGNEPTWGQYAIRWLFSLGTLFLYVVPKYIIDMPPIILVLMFLYLPDVVVIALTGKNQRIGDLAAGTVVIDTTYVPDISTTIYKEIEVTSYKPYFPEVLKLTDKDINGIRQILELKRRDKHTDAYLEQVVAKIKRVLKVESDLEHFDFLQQLLYDYNFMINKN